MENMKKIFTYLLLSSALFSEINSNGDFQIWAREIVKVHITPKWAFYELCEGRFGDNASKLYHTLMQVEGLYTPIPGITMGLGYRQSLRRYPLQSNHWKPEYSPLADVFIRTYLSDWELHDRNRVQYVIFQPLPRSRWLYRNRFRIVPPWNFTKYKINPFIDNEVFFFEQRGFNQDRLCCGLLMQFTNSCGGQIYYMARFEKRENPTYWVHQNILNLTLLLSY